MEGDRVKVHFQGWAARWEEWVEVSSDRLAPHQTKSTKEARAKAAAEKEAVRLAVEEAADAAKARAKAEREAAKAAAKKQAADERLAARVMSPPHARGSAHARLALSHTLSTWHVCFYRDDDVLHGPHPSSLVAGAEGQAEGGGRRKGDDGRGVPAG